MAVKKSATKAKSRKTTASHKTKKKPAAKAKKVVAAKEAMTKTAIIKTIAEKVDIKKSEVTAVLEALGDVVEQHIGPKTAAGAFTLPGLLKIQRIHKPAKKARKGINPFTGEETMFKAKPAHYVVKIRALKKLKDMIAK